MNFLLEQKDVNLNQQDNDGETAMHYACFKYAEGKTFEEKSRFELLFQKKADIELKVFLSYLYCIGLKCISSLSPSVFHKTVYPKSAQEEQLDENCKLCSVPSTSVAFCETQNKDQYLYRLALEQTTTNLQYMCTSLGQSMFFVSFFKHVTFFQVLELRVYHFGILSYITQAIFAKNIFLKHLNFW
jgi:hypothetical protein